MTRLLAVVAGLLLSLNLSAATIHQSSNLGPTGMTVGALADANQYLGSRFSISEQVEVTGVGGHLASMADIAMGTTNNILFAAVIDLTAPTALPNFPVSQIGASAFAVTTFSAGFPSNWVITPLSVALAPGDYALVFGSGLFGGDATGTMPTNNTDLAGASYFFGDALGWHEGGVSGLHFVVEGDFINAVPIPAGLWLFLSALTGWSLVCRRRVTTS